MKTAKNENMFVTSNPHITDSMNTPKIMSLVILALLPSLIASIYIFGFRALMLALVCVISAVFFEWAFEKITKKPNTAGDMSAVLTGLLIAMNVPVTLPYWQGVIGSFVAIVIRQKAACSAPPTQLPPRLRWEYLRKAALRKRKRHSL